jgi:uncharacterized membrane protein HdeD (DUF308 family)
MKPIRYFAAALLLLTGVLHILPMFKTPSDPNSLPMLGFGIVYFTIGVLLILKVRYDSLLGIIFPVIGLLTGFVVIGLKSWNTMLTLMFAIDAVVAVCCLIMFLNKDKA